MSKRIMVILLLCLSMMVLFQTQAMAWSFKYPSGFGTGSYHAFYTITGGQKPGTNTTFVGSHIVIKQASLVCVNPGTNQMDVRGGKGGITFDIISDLAGAEESYDERGKFFLTTTPLCSSANVSPSYPGECLSYDFNALWDVYNTDCRNTNWAPYQYLIQELNLTGTILTDCDVTNLDNPTNCATSAAITLYCETNENPKSWGNNGSVTYTCVDAGSPIAWNDSYSVRVGKSLSVKTPGVLSNDHDTGDPTTITTLTVGSVFGYLDGSYQEISVGYNTEFQTESGGQVIISPDGSFTVTGFTTSDSFTYKAKDTENNLSNSATVTINVY